MTADLSVLLSSLLGLFSLIAVGFIAVRANILPASVSSPFSSLLMKIALPASLFTSMIRPLDPGFVRTMVLTLVLTFSFILLFA